MPRDVHGKAVKPEKHAGEPEHESRSEERKSDQAEDKAMLAPHVAKIEENSKRLDHHDVLHGHHNDRLDRIESILGKAHKASGFKPEDQGGKDGKVEAGHVTEKAGKHSIYSRKRS
jgi:hypothetical protein